MTPGHTASGCIDHLNFCGETCPDCGDQVDAYGNTANQFKFCAFPDCGCDGARLCMAGEASERAIDDNVEGMWSGKSREQISARKRLIVDTMIETIEDRNKSDEDVAK